MVNLQFYRIKMKCTWSMYENKSENELNNISGINYIQLPIKKKKKKDFFKFFFLQFLLYTDQEKYVMNYWPKVLINLAVPVTDPMSQKQLQSNNLNCLHSAEKMLISWWK